MFVVMKKWANRDGEHEAIASREFNKEEDAYVQAEKLQKDQVLPNYAFVVKKVNQ